MAETDKPEVGRTGTRATETGKVATGGTEAGKTEAGGANTGEAETMTPAALVSCVTAGLPQLRTPRRRSFTAAKQRVFLDTLAATCNVTLAVKAAGVSWVTPFKHRREDAGFAAQWASALEVVE